MLDLCFGEIEQFVTRLQHAAKDAKDASKSDGRQNSGNNRLRKLIINSVAGQLPAD
jgi:hypothetical protein